MDLEAVHVCFLKKLSGVRMLTTFYLAKNDHRRVTFISLDLEAVHVLEPIAIAEIQRHRLELPRPSDAPQAVHLGCKKGFG